MTSSIPMVAVQQKLAGRQWRTAGIVVGIEGTAYPGFDPVTGLAPPSMILDDGTGFWSGFSSGLVGGLINALDGLWDSYLVPYKAPTLPMWPGVQESREKTVAYLLSYSAMYLAAWGVYPPTVLTGYSQGSMGVDQVWVYDILTPPGSTDPSGKPTGRLHFLKDFVYRIYQFGHIFRTPGVAKGNALIGLPESIKSNGVETGGIGTTMDLTVDQAALLAPDLQPIMHSCANKGDIYTCNPCGINPWTDCAPEGTVGHDFEQVVMQPSLSAIMKLPGVLLHPFAGIMELFHVMKFFAEGPNAPHYLYFPQMVGCISDCYQLGLSLPHTL